jgi:two-component system sensor histidine kinase ChiS
MLTARNAPEDISAGFEVGANDYITKPVDKTELLLRVRNFVELKKSGEKQRKLFEIQKDLAIAKEIQNQILPREIQKLGRVEIAVKYVPMETIGGDYYDFHVIDQNRMGIFIADVAGHGISAALLGAMMKISFSTHKDLAEKPHELLRALDNDLATYTENLFITAQYMVLDFINNTCLFSNAGHWPACLITQNGSSLIPLYTRGRPLGTGHRTEFALAKHDIASGNRLYIFTDGIIECRNRSGELFGEERLQQLFFETKDLPAEKALESVLYRASQWTGRLREDRFDDDVCIVCVDIM